MRRYHKITQASTDLVLSKDIDKRVDDLTDTVIGVCVPGNDVGLRRRHFVEPVVNFSCIVLVLDRPRNLDARDVTLGCFELFIHQRLRERFIVGLQDT